MVLWPSGRRPIRRKMQLLATRFGALRLVIATIGLLVIGAGTVMLVAGQQRDARGGKHVVSLDGGGTPVAAHGAAVRAAIAGGDSEAAQSFAESRSSAKKHSKARVPRSNTA